MNQFSLASKWRAARWHERVPPGRLLSWLAIPAAIVLALAFGANIAGGSWAGPPDQAAQTAPRHDPGRVHRF